MIFTGLLLLISFSVTLEAHETSNVTKSIIDYKESVVALKPSIAKSISSSENIYQYSARKKRKGNKGGGHKGGEEHIQIVNTHDDSDSYEILQDHKKGKSKRGKRKKGGYKKGQKKNKYMKHITPISLCVLALKILFQHFLIKKLFVVSFLSFLLSKTSFILSSLLTLKQLFHTGHQEKSDNNGKLEVVHIPIRKKQPEFHERESEIPDGTLHSWIPTISDLANEFKPYEHSDNLQLMNNEEVISDSQNVFESPIPMNNYYS